ncbi:hypothetical protein YQE_01126, partial [Dendroctonus ponderosae]
MFTEQAISKERFYIQNPNLSSLGVMDVLLDEEPAIFTKSKKDFTPLDKVTHVVIANKFMVLAMANNVLFRMNLHSPSERNGMYLFYLIVHTEISLNKYTQGKLTNLFLDPTGNHLFLTFASKSKSTEMPELMYLSRKSDKIKTSGKFRTNEFTAIGWNNMNESDSTTGPILLGTSKGLIFETEISLEGDKFFAPSLEQYWRQVFDIGKNTNTPVTTLEYFQVPGTNKYMIFAATPSRLYYFYGSAEMEEKPVLQQVFQKYLNVSETDIFLASESRLGYSRLQFWSENLIMPNQFAWVTEKGIYFGQIDDLKDNRIATVKDKVSLLPYPKPLYEDYSQSPKYPIAIALTEFHILLAYTDSIKGMCLLSKEVVYEDQYNEAFGKLVSVIRDSRTGNTRALDPKQKTQITMLVVWVVELYLTKLEEIRLQGLEKSASYDEVQKQFETFIALQEVADCIRSNKSTIYELMESHGDKGNLIKLTIVSKDFERVTDSPSYFQKQLPRCFRVLMQEVPKPLVNTLIDQGKKLGPLRLLPALVSCNGELHYLEVIRYLEFCIVKLKNADKAIHNLLVSFYAKYDSKKLMEYLNSQGQEVSLINYDVYFTLRLCAEQQQNEACVKLYGLLNLWESAVDLALKVNLELAKTMADMSPENDLELKKKLWLKIAQHVVSEKNDIQEAMKYLSDLIKIEDILPFFSDFLTIDHFKDAICNSLREYNQKIQALKEEMEEATNSAEQVRNEIHSFRNCFTYISSADKCEVCNMILMVRPFYFFPCNHMFHSDCLLAELEPCLGMTKRNRLSDLEKQLESLNTQSNSDNNSTGLSGMTRRDQVKAEIDNIIASECLYCGENMIRNVDKPFIEDFEYESITREWQ